MGRARSACDRACDRAPKARDSTPRARDNAPRACDSAPKARDSVPSARDGSYNVRALCCAHDSALCCALFGSLFMDTIHEHCSWTLFKKKSTKITLGIWGVTLCFR